jgi:methionyl-tRNA synthetase
VTAADRQTIIVSATPTPNGDLHVGHLAGPYLAGDVHARYLRAAGRAVVYTTCTDDNQTYVASTAARQGTTPEALCAGSTAAITRTLDAAGVSMAGLPPIDDRYRSTVLEFLGALYDAGRFRLRRVRLPFVERTGTYLFDGLVGGICPECSAGSCGGVCEDCGHPNNFDELIAPYSTLDPGDDVVFRESSVLVLPLEDYRDRLTAYYAARAGRWRPHAMQLVRELLDRPLPEVPVTMPGTRGIPAPFAETPGQIIYPWVEAMPASMYATWWAADPEGQRPAATDEHWRAEHDARLVYFHGFDNTYHWGLLDLALLMAHGDRYVLPETNICNEFFELDGEKFSTSRNHLIRATDLLRTTPRDLVRFHLALTGPENQRTNFTLDGLASVPVRLLVDPWNALADELAAAVKGIAPGTGVPTTPEGRRRAAAMADRFRSSYELHHYSVARVAETLAAQLARLRTATAPVDPGDLILLTRTLLAHAAPILIDVAERAAACGVDLSPGTAQPVTVPAFVLPRLTAPLTVDAPVPFEAGIAVGVPL